MTRRPTAPDSALTVRTVVALTIPLLYIVVRLWDVTSPLEAALSWVGAAVCGGIVIVSTEELAVRKALRAERVRAIREAVTETFAAPMRWPDIEQDHPVEQAIAVARHAALIDNGEIVEPKLFTHEYQPLTPPRGFSVLDDSDALRHAVAYVGRHRSDAR
jgi:hypothetical protein